MIDIFLWTSLLLQQMQERLLAWIDGILPPIPAEVASACGQLQGYASQSAWVTALVPTWAISIAGGLIAAVVVASIAIRVARMVLSVSSGGGGA